VDISKGDKIEFNIVIPTAKGAIFACRFLWNEDLAGVSTDAGSKMNIQKAHRLLGHGNKESTRQTAKQCVCVTWPPVSQNIAQLHNSNR